MITVILCTYNRCRSLEVALASVAKSVFPDSEEWEVLVVDNNSSDQTREVATNFCQRYPNRFRYLFEPRPGKSYALNSGIEEARGEVLAFLDDDVTVESTWLRNLTAGLAGGEWAGAGGRILPQWPCTPPSWLPKNKRYGMAPLVMFDLGTETGQLTEPPFGTNMAFHRRIFERYGNFRTDLGPRENIKMFNEDTEFGGRLLAAGERLRYEPAAVVRHAVPIDRLRKDYFLTWWFDKARSDVRVCGATVDTRWRIQGIPLYLCRRLAAWTVRWMIAVGPSRRFTCRVNVWSLCGTILESHLQWSEQKLKQERLA